MVNAALVREADLHSPDEHDFEISYPRVNHNILSTLSSGRSNVLTTSHKTEQIGHADDVDSNSKNGMEHLFVSSLPAVFSFKPSRERLQHVAQPRKSVAKRSVVPEGCDRVSLRGDAENRLISLLLLLSNCIMEEHVDGTWLPFRESWREDGRSQ